MLGNTYKAISVEDLEELFPENRFGQFLADLAYTWDVNELGGIEPEQGDFHLLITKERFISIADVLGVNDTTMLLLKSHIPNDVFIDLVPVAAYHP